MATLLTTIPSLAFPHELDVIQFQAGEDEYDVEISVSVAGQTVLETVLVFDTDGLAGLDDMATFLTDHLKTQSAFTLKYGETTVSSTLLPCRLEIRETAVEFCPKSFLTALQGKKVTAYGCKEFLSIYATAAEKGTVTFLSVDAEGNVKSTSKEIAHKTNTKGIYTYDVSAALFDPDADGANGLLQYTVRVGNRRQDFVLMPDAYGGRCIFFHNGFGCLESFYFCEVERVAKPTRHNSVFAGQYMNYLVTENTTYKGISRPLSESEVMLADDIVHACELWMQGTEIPLAVTDNELKTLSSAEDMPRLSLTWRTSRARTPFVPVRPVRTFDVTFDKTFF